jgi:hypothetical protein
MGSIQPSRTDFDIGLLRPGPCDFVLLAPSLHAKRSGMSLSSTHATVRYRGVFDNATADTLAKVKAVTGFASSGYETAFFYFNSENNIELLLKLLDQGNKDSQGHPTIAVLYGSATQLRVELTITDTQTTAVKKYTSLFNTQKGETDFAAFVK